MSRSNHTEAQMIGALKQLEAGRKAEDVALVFMMVTGAILALSRRLQVQEFSEKLRLVKADL